METKLYVGNLPFDATEDEIKEFFAQAGEVQSVTLISDRFSGQSKGFGFIEMTDQESLQKAINILDGSTFKDRQLKVNIARPKEDRRPEFCGNRGGRGSPRGGGGGGARRPRY